MRRRSSTRDPVDVQRELSIHNKLKNTVIGLWAFLSVAYGIVQSGTLTNATLYAEYLGCDAGVGRYLIAMYGFGQLSFRILVTLAPKPVKKVIESTGYMMKYLLMMVFAIAALAALWLFTPVTSTLYFVFPAIGLLIGGLGPYSIRLADSISPISGSISCIFMMLYGAGDFLIVFVNGELIATYTAMIQPAAISGCCLLSLPVVTLPIFLHRRDERIQTSIVGLTGLVIHKTGEDKPQSLSPLPTPACTPEPPNVATHVIPMRVSEDMNEGTGLSVLIIIADEGGKKTDVLSVSGMTNLPQEQSTSDSLSSVSGDIDISVPSMATDTVSVI